MDKEAWWVKVHGVARARQDLANKLPQEDIKWRIVTRRFKGNSSFPKEFTKYITYNNQYTKKTKLSIH